MCTGIPPVLCCNYNHGSVRAPTRGHTVMKHVFIFGVDEDGDSLEIEANSFDEAMEHLRDKLENNTDNILSKIPMIDLDDLEEETQ